MNKTQATADMKAFQNNVAMTVALVSWGMMFATMFLGYFLVRFSTPVWPPVEIQGMPKLLPLLSTLVLALSSYTYWRLEKKAFTDIPLSKLFWVLTMIFGVAFLILQWILWGKLKEAGIFVTNGMVPSMVYAFSWIHAGHIVLGLLALMYVGHYVFTKRAELTEAKLLNVGKFWHFLGVVWLIMYLMMFVL